MGRDEYRPLTGVEIAQRQAESIAVTAGEGWRVEVAKDYPWGWLLFDPSGELRQSGSLDQIQEWVTGPGYYEVTNEHGLTDWVWCPRPPWRD